MRSMIFAAFALALCTSPAWAAPADDGAPTLLAKTKKKTKAKTKAKSRPAPAAKARSKKRTKKRSKKRRDERIVDSLLKKGAIGLQVGFSGASFECDCVGAPGEQEYDSTYNLAAGVVYDKSLNRFLSYRGGLRYHAKGTAYEVGSQDFEVILTTAEVEGALLLRYGLNPYTSLYLSFGGFAGAILGVDATLDGKKSTALKDNFSVVDYGLGFGGGAFFALSRSRGLMASATLTYQHGLADIASDEQNLPEDDSLLTRAVQITAGLHF